MVTQIYSFRCQRIKSSTKRHNLFWKAILSEHGPWMELCERTLGACKKTPRKQESYDLSIFKTRNCSWNVFSGSSQVFRIGSASFRLSLLLAGNHSIKCLNYPFDAPYGKTCFFFLPRMACPCNCTLYLCDSSYPSEYTLSEALRLTIAGDFSLPHSLVPPSQVPPSLEWRHYSNCSRGSLGLWVLSNFVWCSIFLFLFATICYW